MGRNFLLTNQAFLEDRLDAPATQTITWLEDQLIHHWFDHHELTVDDLLAYGTERLSDELSDLND